MGKCSVPMWIGGSPAGTCDNEAYGNRPPGRTKTGPAGYEYRDDGRYAGYVAGLACPIHGGPRLSEVAHQGDPCIHCGTPHDEVDKGPCRARAPEYFGAK